MFKTEEELLRHFEEGGCMIDKDTGEVYISDVNDMGEFFGIFASEPVGERDSLERAVEDAYYMPMSEYEAPGWWFGRLAEEVIANPARFATE